MIEMKIDGASCEVCAKGKHADLLSEAIYASLQLDKFVYQRLGKDEFLLYLLKKAVLTDGDKLIEFLNEKPDSLTHIEIPIPHEEGDN